MRATPLPPDERRQAIIAAARPLLIANGTRFTTRQVAEAAGIAEGTIFRVFSTKQALLNAVIEDALDPRQVVAQIESMPAQPDLVTHVALLLDRLHGRLESAGAVMAALHALPMADDVHCERSGNEHGPASHRERATEVRRVLADSLTPWADELRTPVDEAAALISTLAFAAHHPYSAIDLPTDPALLAEFIVHGIHKD